MKQNHRFWQWCVCTHQINSFLPVWNSQKNEQTIVKPMSMKHFCILKNTEICSVHKKITKYSKICKTQLCILDIILQCKLLIYLATLWTLKKEHTNAYKS